MRKILAVLTLIMLCAFSALAKQVVVDGYGATAKQAEADALRNAVENVMGTVVDSKTMTESHKLLEDRVLTYSSGYITDYKVLEKNKDQNGWQVTVDADVDTRTDSKLMNDLVRLGVIDLSLRNPRIGVVIYDDGRSADSTSAESAMVKAFLDNGFTNVINSDDYSSYSKEAWHYDEGDLRLLAAKMKVDLLVVGKATHTYNGDVGKFLDDDSKKVDMYPYRHEYGRRRYYVHGRRVVVYENRYYQRDNDQEDKHPTTGMLSCRAEVDVRMYSVKTGRIIVSESKVGGGVDTSKSIAINNAVREAAALAADALSDKLLTEGAGNRQLVSLVAKVADFRKLDVLRYALERIEQVKMVELRSYEDGEGLFQIQYKGSPEQLFKLLQKQAECSVVLQSVSYDGLVIKAY